MDTKGSLVIEIILWLLMILPGAIYTVWRLTTKAPACRECGSRELIPPDSPRALKLSDGASRSVESSARYIPGIND